MRFGYLRKGVCSLTETSLALARFQRVMKLAPTGMLNEPTAKAIETPRCAVPDTQIALLPDGPAPYVLVGCSYERLSFTYRFVNATPDISVAAQRAAVGRAFNTWSSVLCDIVFQETSGEADFDVGWFSGDHGDGTSFDGPGRVIAHAYYPPPCGGSFAGTLHFDDAEPWTTDVGAFDLETVALHEIGHNLGLAHSLDVAAIMYPTYRGTRRSLGADDINGIRRLYPMICRRGSGQAGSVDEIDSVRGSTSTQLVTAVRSVSGTLVLLTWSVSSSGVIAQRGSSGTKAGAATSIKIARNQTGTRYLTVCRAGNGNMAVIGWDLSADGASIVRLGSRVSGPVSRASIANVTDGLFVTAARVASGNLLLESWRLSSGGTVTKLASAAAGAVGEVAIARLSASRVVTAVKAGDGRLLLMAWQVTSSGVITRVGSALDVASTQIAVAIDGFGNPVTAARDASGNLRLTTWNVGSGGAVVRRESSGADSGTSSENSLSYGLGHIVSTVRASDGELKTILWSTTSDGAITRVGDSAWLAGPGSRPSVSAEMAGPRVVTSVRAANGTLQLATWQR